MIGLPPWLTTSATTATFLAQDGAYAFRVRARDQAGNWSAWSIAATTQVDAITITKYYFFNGQRIAMRSGGDLTYLHGDHLGSASLATDASGALVSAQRYLPYGEVRWNSGDLPTDRQFTGQRREASLGLVDYGARMYDPALGRFLQADTLIPDPSNPQAFNRYLYVLGNPLRYTDPSGHLPDDLIKEYVTSDLDSLPTEVLSMLRALHFGDSLTGIYKEIEYIPAIRLGQAVLDSGHNLAFEDSVTGNLTSINDVVAMYENREILGFNVYAPFSDHLVIYSTQSYALGAGYENYDYTVSPIYIMLKYEYPLMLYGAAAGTAGGPAGALLGLLIGLITSEGIPRRAGQDVGDRVLTTVYTPYLDREHQMVQRTILRDDQIIENCTLSYVQYIYLSYQGW